MGSAITFSGFNDIDFNTVLNAIMQQESQPLVALQTRQTAMEARAKTFVTLATRVSTLQSAAAALSDPSTTTTFKATSNDPASIGVSTSSTAVPGRYDIVVTELARAQVMASSSSTADADTTIVASSGALTINGHAISVSGPVTLRQLADTINNDSSSPVRASVVQASAASFRLVLTGKNTGAANSFTVTNTLGSGVTFTDTDNDQVSGDDDADNAVKALDASLKVNNLTVTSASNTLSDVIPGSTLTLYKKDALSTVVVDVAEDMSALKTKLQSFVTAYNDFVKFIGDQVKSAASGDSSSIGREPLVRHLRTEMRAALTTQYTTGSTLTSLAQAGVELTQTGTLQLNDATFDEAVKNGTTDLSLLLAGKTGTPGALTSISTLLTGYTQTHGLLFEARDQLTAAANRLDAQITGMEARLLIRRTTLQQEFTAADAAMSRLKGQSSSLASFSSNL